MDTKSLEIVLDVAREGSFAAAARRHAIDPSAVSRTVAAVEAALGARLFQRTTRRLSLTEAGARYIQRIGPLMEELDRAGEEARSFGATPTGSLRLTTSVAFGLECVVPLLGAFRDAYPALSLDLLLTDANVDLVAERVDLAIRLAPALTADLIGARLMTTRYRVCASPDYLAGQQPIRDPADLADHPCLVFTLPGFRSRWLFRDRSGAVAENPVRGDIAISNATALKAACLAGLGPALLANWLVDRQIAAGRLVDLFPDHDVTATTFDTAAWLLYPSRAFLPNKVRVAIDFLRVRLAN